MTSALLFREGPDLESLLADIDAEHNGLARVVEISRVRDGGMFGFFARTNVNVTYTLEDEDEVYEHHAERGSSGLDRADIVEFSTADTGSSYPAAPHEFAMDGLLQSPTQDHDEAPGPVEPAEDEANVEFARMLLDLASRKAAERGVHLACAEPEGAPKAEPDTIPETSWAATPTPEPDTIPETSWAATRTAEPDTTSETSWAATPEPVLDNSDLLAAARAATLAQATLAQLSPHTAGLQPAPAVEPVRFPDHVTSQPARPAGAHRSPEPAHDESPAVAPIPTTSLGPALTSGATSAPEARLQALGAPVDQLLALGVPKEWIPATCSSLGAALEQLVGMLPTAPLPDPRPGQLIAVAGPVNDARAEAVRLCERLGLDHPVIHDSAELLGAPQALDQSVGEVRVVVIATDLGDDPTGLDCLRAAGRSARALNADFTLLVTDASAPADDLRSTAAALGRVDALAVVRGSRTARPAQTWGSQLPILSIDGRLATAGTWAGLLFDAAARAQASAQGVWS